MLGGLGSVAMGQGSSISGGDAGPAESKQDIRTDIQTGFGGSGAFTVGDYFSKGAKVSKTSPLNNLVVIGGLVLVAIWLLKKK